MVLLIVTLVYRMNRCLPIEREKMNINGIDFPNEIIESIQDNKLVVFVGAGVSVGAPTLLPNFEDLADEIASGSGEKRGEESCEAFLGKLKFRNINVNNIVAEKLSGLKLTHNELHKHIINLFPDGSNIRIVTTNYDQMLEQVLAKNKLKVFNAPALPVGNNINGIVHIHGNIDDPEYMVLTDEDFGKAYLVDGYVSRFLVKLFESYTVLFVGYSYNDVIMRYLTRAMVNDGSSRRFIMTDDTTAEWNRLGIIPILFLKNDFATLYKGFEILGDKVNRKPSDWKMIFESIAKKPPIDYSEESEIEFCLEDRNKTCLFMDIIHGEEWLWWLDKRKVFNKIFSNNSILEDIDTRWVEWIINEFVTSESCIIERLIINHGGYNILFANSIIRSIVHHEDSDSYTDVIIDRNVCLFNDDIKDAWMILKLVEVLAKRSDYRAAWKLFKRLFEYKVVPKKQWLSLTGDAVDYALLFKGEEFQVQKSWKTIRDDVLKKFPIEVLEFGKGCLKNIHNDYSLLKMADEENEPWTLQLLPIEGDENHHSSDSILLHIVKMIEDAFLETEKSQDAYAKEFIRACIISDSVLLKRIGLKLLRECHSINDNQKAEIVLNKFDIYSLQFKEQLFLLMAEVFDEISDDNQNQIIEAIVEGCKSEHDEKDAYKKYNWCIWIQRKCKFNSKIEDLLNEIKSKYTHFQPRENPELSIVSSSGAYSGNESPISEQEIYGLESESLIKELKEYHVTSFEGPNRNGLLSALSNCIKENYEWAIKMIEKFVSCLEDDSDVWTYIFGGITYSEYSSKKMYEALILFNDEKFIYKYYKEISSLIENILAKAEKQEIAEYEEYIWDITLKILEIKIYDERQYECRTIDLCLNLATGICVANILKLYSNCEDPLRCTRYLNYLEKIIADERKDKKEIYCIIGRQFNYLYNREKEWCIKNVLPLLCSENNDIYAATWEGYVHFAGYLHFGKEKDIQNLYLDSVERIYALSKDARHSFIELYAVLVTKIIDNPITEFIPVFLRKAEKEEKIAFAGAISICFDTMNDEEKENVWSRWIRQYLKNRITNIPVAFENEELNEILTWIFKLEKQVTEFISIITKAQISYAGNISLLYELQDNEWYINYSTETAELLGWILKADNIPQDILCEIQKLVGILSKVDKSSCIGLKESLLRQGVKI